MSAFDAVQLLDLTHDAILVMDAHGVIRYWNRGAGETFGFPAEEALGRRADELLNTEFTDSRETIEADVLESGAWDGELIHHSRDGRRIVCASRWVAWEEARSGLPYLLEVSREITAQKEAERRAQRERQQLLSVLNVIPGYVAIKDADCRVRFANDGFLAAFGEPGDRPCHEVQYGRARPCPHCELREVIEHGRPSQWEACYANGKAYRVWMYPFYTPGGERVALEMGVDVTEEKEALRMVAEAGETERRQIGRDLHDSIGQKLTALGYLVGGLASRFAELSPEERSLADKTTELVKDCITEIRAIARGLNPVDLGEQGLHDALQELVRSMEITADVTCHVDIDPAIELSSNKALSVYRIAQEAITNAARHGQAEQIWLTFDQLDGHAVLSVRDDGVGISPAAMHPGNGDEGLGLRTMRHRAATMNGRLRVAPHQDGGTLVTCSLPLTE
jgi:PAS domain S-box-containing protein